MSNFVFSSASKKRLRTVHEDLEDLAHAALRESTVDFGVSEGARSLERQRELVEAGASWTMNSRHLLRIPVPGPPEPCAHAIDVYAWVNGKVRWDWPLYNIIARAFKAGSVTLDVPIEWGGDWSETRRDGPHFQLPWDEYPVRIEGA